MRHLLSISRLAALILILSFLLSILQFFTALPSSQDVAVPREDFATGDATRDAPSSRCAINFWGLPRAFESLVLPSLIENVIKPNSKHGCDYFVHYYVQTQEPAGRSGQGGQINPKEVLLLKDAVHTVAKEAKTPLPLVEFVSDTEEDFWKQYMPLIEKIRTAKDDQGRYLYFPWKAKTYKHPVTTDNIIKMWHTIQESYRLMEQTANKNGITYSRIGMFRSDVMYVTPVDIWQISSQRVDTENKYAVVPGFGRHPVSDRIVYGPARAVKIWATERFPRLEAHVDWILKNDPGWGLHSERFVNYTLFPAMRKEGVEIVEHDTICFFRARSDESVWISDCLGTPEVALQTISKNIGNDQKGLVEKVLGRKCGEVTKTKRPIVASLDCSRKNNA